jgi:hypothetical protein
MTSGFEILPWAVTGGEAGGVGSAKPTSKYQNGVVHVTFWLISASSEGSYKNTSRTPPTHLINLYSLRTVINFAPHFF